MPTAVNQSVQHPKQALDGLAGALARLAQLDVEVRYTRSPTAAISRYDGRTRVLTVRSDTCLEDQVWVLSQAWFHVAIGPWASQARKVVTLHVVPNLPSVPTQREDLDNTA